MCHGHSTIALACGADASYIYEEKFSITDLMECLGKIVEKFEMKKITRGLVLRLINIKFYF